MNEETIELVTKDIQSIARREKAIAGTLAVLKERVRSLNLTTKRLHSVYMTYWWPVIYSECGDNAAKHGQWQRRIMEQAKDFKPPSARIGDDGKRGTGQREYSAHQKINTLKIDFEPWPDEYRWQAVFASILLKAKTKGEMHDLLKAWNGARLQTGTA